MAEIHVQTKKHSAPGSMWIWIVVVLIIAAAVIYYLVSRNKNAGTAAPPANTTSFLYHSYKAVACMDKLQAKNTTSYGG